MFEFIEDSSEMDRYEAVGSCEAEPAALENVLEAQ